MPRNGTSIEERLAQAQLAITNALSPAKVNSIKLNEEERSAYVIVPDNQLSLAIGKGGQNVRLAARLTDWKIDIRSEAQATAEAKEKATAGGGGYGDPGERAAEAVKRDLELGYISEARALEQYSAFSGTRS